VGDENFRVERGSSINELYGDNEDPYFPGNVRIAYGFMKEGTPLLISSSFEELEGFSFLTNLRPTSFTIV